MRLWHRVAWAVVSAAVLMLNHAASAADQERWSILLMNGQRSGWQLSVIRENAGQITTESKTTMSVGRGATAMSIVMQTRFVETTDGKPVSMWMKQELAAAPVEQLWEWTPEKVKLTVTSGGEKQEEEIAKPEGEWLTPAAAQREVAKRIAAGESEIKIRSVDPSLGLQVATITRKNFVKTKVDLASGPVEVTRCTSVIEGYPESTEYLDAAGDAIKLETSLGGFSVAVLRSDRATALGAFEGPEMMVSTFVRPDRPIANARTLTSAVYRLSMRDASMPDLPTVGGQSVRRDEAALIVTVDSRGSSPAEPGDRQSKAYTASSPMINFDDSKVKALGKVAIQNGSGQTPAQMAETLRRFVHSYINRKELGVGLGSAGEVARTRTGDCTEHGVLLAALLRGQGIPSRVATGLIYADRFAGSADIFGYHMWAQALLEVDGKDRWVDFDATLSNDTPYDATHLTLGTTGLEDGGMEKSMLTTATLMGRLIIQVQQTQ